MWVKTPSGSLCNLSRSSEITVDRHTDPDATAKEVTWRIHAWPGRIGPDEPRTVIAEYGTEEAARRHLKGLAGLIGTVKCELKKGESS